MYFALLTAFIPALSPSFGGGAMLDIPVFHWFGHDFESVAVPTGRPGEQSNGR